jgi:hypothetical protein
VLGPGASRGLRDWAVVVARHLQKKYFLLHVTLISTVLSYRNEKTQLRYLS